MSNTLRYTILTSSLLCLASLAPVAQAAPAPDGDGWNWMIAPYGWFASVGTDLRTTIPPGGGISSDTNFGNLINKIDGAFEIHAEGKGEQFGMFTDYTYLGLGDSHDFPRFHTNTQLDTTLFELAGVWSPDQESLKGWDLFAGVRYIGVDLNAHFQPADPLFPIVKLDGKDTYTDFMIGTRYTWQLSDRWDLTLRGDGSFGQTDGTWNVSGVAQYRMKNGAWLFGYRYLSVTVKTGNRNTDITMNGPMIGYGFKF